MMTLVHTCFQRVSFCVTRHDSSATLSIYWNRIVAKLCWHLQMKWLPSNSGRKAHRKVRTVGNNEYIIGWELVRYGFISFPLLYASRHRKKSSNRDCERAHRKRLKIGQKLFKRIKLRSDWIDIYKTGEISWAVILRRVWIIILVTSSNSAYTKVPRSNLVLLRSCRTELTKYAHGQFNI